MGENIFQCEYVYIGIYSLSQNMEVKLNCSFKTNGCH